MQGGCTSVSWSPAREECSCYEVRGPTSDVRRPKSEVRGPFISALYFVSRNPDRGYAAHIRHILERIGFQHHEVGEFACLQCADVAIDVHAACGAPSG